MTDDSVTASHLLPRSAALILVLSGLAGGLVGWLFIEQFHGSFTISEEMRNAPGPPYSPEVEVRIEAESRIADYWNSALAIGLFGASVSGSLGLSVGVIRKSNRAAIAGLLVGIVLGGSLGFLGGFAEKLVGEHVRSRFDLDKSYAAMAMHATAWICVAIAIALAVGLSMRRASSILRAFGAAVAAGLIVAMLYPLLAAMLFPTRQSELPVPEGTWNRWFWTALAAGTMGLAVGRVLISPKSDRA